MTFFLYPFYIVCSTFIVYLYTTRHLSIFQRRHLYIPSSDRLVFVHYSGKHSAWESFEALELVIHKTLVKSPGTWVDSAKMLKSVQVQCAIISKQWRHDIDSIYVQILNYSSMNLINWYVYQQMPHHHPYFTVTPILNVSLAFSNSAKRFTSLDAGDFPDITSGFGVGKTNGFKRQAPPAPSAYVPQLPSQHVELPPEGRVKLRDLTFFENHLELSFF